MKRTAWVLTKIPLSNVSVLFVVLCLLSACSEKRAKTEQSINQGQQEDSQMSSLRGQSLAQVNDTSIYQAELDYAIERLNPMLSRGAEQGLIDKVLDSLVTSRAMALLAEQSLSGEDKQRLAIKVQAYKEELLVKRYIEDHADPQPVTSDMVKKYYQENPKEFGGDTIKAFEFISSNEALDDKQREALNQAFARASNDTDFKKLAENLQQKTFNVRYKKAEMRMAMLQAPLKELVEQTKVGQQAPIYNKSQVILLRVLTERSTPAKPLAEVSAQIRKRLSPLKLKQAMKVLTQEVKQKANVSITRPVANAN